MVALPVRFWSRLLVVANIEARGSVSGHICERKHKAGNVTGKASSGGRDGGAPYDGVAWLTKRPSSTRDLLPLFFDQEHEKPHF
jgi:hypothetical protein